ncbi:MAG: acetylglutamate kinase [Rhodospirillaceae bacterium]|nr:acetylglutamate kinase [Rhodospirillaceae bacterium]HAA92610.1 acetylglutamate kinase [Rhodospirillaceae bacterium]
MADKAKRRAEWLEKAGILTEALPYMRRYAGKTFVIKYGGHAMGDAKLAAGFAHDIVLLQQVGIYPVVVHGGGPQIGAMLERLKIKSEFIDGLRVTDAATVEIVEMVLSGQINKQIVADINSAGGTAIGISGKDGGLITVEKASRTTIDPDSNIEKVVDLGFVGEPTVIDPYILDALQETEIIPVIAPLGSDGEGQTFNINADTVAGAVAAGVDATRLLLLTDVEGVLDKSGKLISELTLDEARSLMKDGTISGGMIPKLETCIQAIEDGAEGAVIIDGRVPHGVLLEIFTEHGSGTLIRA